MKMRQFIGIVIMGGLLLVSQRDGIAANILSEMYKQLGLSENITYTADMVIESAANQAAMPEASKVFFKNGNIRTEGKQGTMKFISIIRTDGTVYSLMESSNTWMKSDLGEAMKNQPLPQYKQAGSETIDGKSCLKYEMTDSETNMSGVVWVSDGMIIKNQLTIFNQVTTVYYKNISKEPLDDALFMPPASDKIQDMATLMEGTAQSGE
ncbi:MAG: DUF4412 domain-containing protein [Candidatus Aureabacteria bacterium]|nr:DUF4412 domain-containing protein [Candidatus Auribacterota bacterium]